MTQRISNFLSSSKQALLKNPLVDLLSTEAKKVYDKIKGTINDIENDIKSIATTIDKSILEAKDTIDDALIDEKIKHYAAKRDEINKCIKKAEKEIELTDNYLDQFTKMKDDLETQKKNSTSWVNQIQIWKGTRDFKTEFNKLEKEIANATENSKNAILNKDMQVKIRETIVSLIKKYDKLKTVNNGFDKDEEDKTQIEIKDLIQSYEHLLHLDTQSYGEEVAEKLEDERKASEAERQMKINEYKTHTAEFAKHINDAAININNAAASISTAVTAFTDFPEQINSINEISKKLLDPEASKGGRRNRGTKKRLGKRQSKRRRGIVLTKRKKNTRKFKKL